MIDGQRADPVTPAPRLLSVPRVARLTEQLPALRPRSLESVLSLLTGIVAWEIAGRLLDFAFLPPFSRVLQACWRMTLSGEIPSNLAVSLMVLVVGYSLAVALGVPCGLMIGRYRTLEYIFEPYLSALLAVPNLLYVPIFFSFFGISRLTQLSVVFLYSFVIITYSAAQSIRSVDPTYIEMARAFGATEPQLVRRVLIPAALPMIMAGLRLGMGRAVHGMINGEMLIVVVGLGALLRRYGSRFDAASVFAVLLYVIAIALIGAYLVRAVDRRLNRWAAPQEQVSKGPSLGPERDH